MTKTIKFGDITSLTEFMRDAIECFADERSVNESNQYFKAIEVEGSHDFPLKTACEQLDRSKEPRNSLIAASRNKLTQNQISTQHLSDFDGSTSGIKLHLSINDLYELDANLVKEIVQYLALQQVSPNMQFHFKLAEPSVIVDAPRFAKNDQFTLYFHRCSSIKEIIEFSMYMHTFLCTKGIPENHYPRGFKDVFGLNSFISVRTDTCKMYSIYGEFHFFDRELEKFFEKYRNNLDALANVPLAALETVFTSIFLDKEIMDLPRTGLSEVDSLIVQRRFNLVVLHPEKYLNDPLQLIEDTHISANMNLFHDFDEAMLELKKNERNLLERKYPALAEEIANLHKVLCTEKIRFITGHCQSEEFHRQCTQIIENATKGELATLRGFKGFLVKLTSAILYVVIFKNSTMTKTITFGDITNLAEFMYDAIKDFAGERSDFAGERSVDVSNEYFKAIDVEGSHDFPLRTACEQADRSKEPDDSLIAASRNKLTQNEISVEHFRFNEPTSGIKLHLSINDLYELDANLVKEIVQYLALQQVSPNMQFHFKLAESSVIVGDSRFAQNDQFTLYFDEYSSIKEIIEFSTRMHKFLCAKGIPENRHPLGFNDVFGLNSFISVRTDTCKINSINAEFHFFDRELEKFFEKYRNNLDALANVPLAALETVFTSILIDKEIMDLPTTGLSEVGSLIVQRRFNLVVLHPEKYLNDPLQLIEDTNIFATMNLFHDFDEAMLELKKKERNLLERKYPALAEEIANLHKVLCTEKIRFITGHCQSEEFHRQCTQIIENATKGELANLRGFKGFLVKLTSAILYVVSFGNKSWNKETNSVTRLRKIGDCVKILGIFKTNNESPQLEDPALQPPSFESNGSGATFT